MNTTPMNTKKSWTKPQLLVLVRSQPEEAVLGSCKGYSGGGSPSDGFPGCFNGFCNPCSSPAAS